MAISAIWFASSTPFINLPTKLYRLPLHNLKNQIHKIIFKTPKYYKNKTKTRKNILKPTLWKTTNMSKTTCCFSCSQGNNCIPCLLFQLIQNIQTKLDVDVFNCQYTSISSTNRTLILIQLRTLKKEQNVIVKNK